MNWRMVSFGGEKVMVRGRQGWIDMGEDGRKRRDTSSSISKRVKPPYLGSSVSAGTGGGVW